MRRGLAGGILALALLVTAIAAPMAAARYSASLYDQRDQPGLSFAFSGDFTDPSTQPYNAEVADDFVVPVDEVWHLDRIDVLGRYIGSGFPPPGLNVRIYASTGRFPGALVYSEPGDPASGEPNYHAPLRFPELVAGHYWISVQRMVDPGSDWSWQTRQAQTGDPAVVKSSSCPNWGVRAQCDPSASEPDQLFSVGGIADSMVTFETPRHRRTGLVLIPATFTVSGDAVVQDNRLALSSASASSGAKARIRHRRVHVAVPFTVPSPQVVGLPLPTQSKRKLLPVKPTPRVLRELKNGRTVKVTVRVTFTPTGGEPYVQTIPLKLKRTLPG